MEEERPVCMSDKLERMFLVTEFDHPEHATYRWTKLEVEWINDRIRTAMAAEREACAMACEETGEQPSSLWEEPGCWTQASETCAFAIRMRSNDRVEGRDAALSRRVPSHDGLCGAGDTEKET